MNLRRLTLVLALISAALAAAAPARADPPNLVAAYAFDEASGGIVSDASGNGHFGTIAGATWTAGRHGGALSFNGSSASVDLGGLGTFYQAGFTLEAWVQKQSASVNDVAVVGTWTPSGGPMIWVDHLATRYHLTMNSGFANYLDSGRNPTAGQWQHLAATFDGTTARFYIDGTEVASRTVSVSVGASNSWRIGAYGASAGGFFDGLIDDVRIYNGALTAAQVQTDMNEGVTPFVPPPDTTPPTAPGTLTADGQLNQASLSWSAATDDVGVANYNVYRSTTSGFTPSAANRIAQPTGTNYTNGGLAPGTYYYKVSAQDAADNVGPASNEAAATALAPDTTPPSVAITAPTPGGVSGPVTVSANASDDQAVAGVQFKLDGQNLGAEDTSAPYAVAWDTRGELNGTHSLTAVARDVAGHTTTSAVSVVAVGNSGVSSTGLRAAYGLDDGSGTIARDSSGNNRTANLAGAGWTSTGRFGAALALNGVSAEADLPALGTFYKSGFTYEAWVYKQSLKVDATVVGSWDYSQGGGAMIWIDHLSGHYRLTLGNSFGNFLDSGQAPAVGRWQHVAATYDGTIARFYVDGVETTSTTYTGNVGDANSWRIGAYGASPGGFFDGSIDNVRIYDRALTAAEIETDMASRIPLPDTTPPTAPGTLTANGSFGESTLSWGPASDDFGVVTYDVFRATTSGFTPGAANRIAQPSGTSYTDSGLAPGTYYYKVKAEDSAGNVGNASNEASAAVTADVSPPTAVITAPAGGAVIGPLTITAVASDNQAVAGVQFKLDGQNLGAEDTTAPYSLAWDTRGELNDTHTLTVVARDGAGNTTTSAAVVVVVGNSGVSTTGLRAAYTLDDGSGTIARDSSGNYMAGTLTGAAWTSGGHFGGAITLNGTSALVDLPALGTFYKTGFTYEAWVFKQSPKVDVAVMGTWTSSQSGGAMIWVDHLSGHYRLTLGNSLGNYLDSGQAPAVGRWQHVAATYDGSVARIYIDGVQTATSTFTGNVGNSNSWRIGAYGSSPTGFLDGSIDNVRIYDRALTAAEIDTDMASRLPAPDLTPPSVPGTLSASGGFGESSLSWGASVDNVGVAHYNVYRSTSSGFTPSAANRIAQPAGTSYTDADLSPGTYYYKVSAEDLASNVSTASNQASATVVADTTPPTVALTEPGGGTVSGVIPVSAAASDNAAVAGVQFKLDGQNLGPEDTSSPYTTSWDTRGELNGSHLVTAVARDRAGNSATATAVTVNIANTGPTAGLRAAYGLDQGSGTLAVDSSGNNRTGTLAGAGWTNSGHFGGATTLNGTSALVDLPALGTFYKTGFTYEAWVFKQSSKVDVAVVGSWSASQAGGAMIWVDHQSGHYRLALGAAFGNYLDSGQAPAVGRWQHVAATYNGSVARIYIDGVQTATSTFTGNLGNSNSWRIGAYGSSPTGFFDGSIDNVRIYDRPLTSGEIQTDMASRIQPDGTPPVVTSSSPAAGASHVGVSQQVTATFSKPMQAATVTAGTFMLKDAANNVVPANVTYNAATQTATLTPQALLQLGNSYTPILVGGGASDLAGNALAGDVTWTFTTDVSQPPILVVTSSANPFSSYLTEILDNEGLDDFATVDASRLTQSLLNATDVVLLGDFPVTGAQVSMLTGWVNGGGNLIAMRPDKQLAGLLGLVDAGTTLTNRYLAVDTTAPPGAGIVASTIQYHGTADRYTLGSATAVATLYTGTSTATVNPAVTLRSVGSSGGQAGAFTYDLARSVVYTRQGNPAWAGQERDGVVGIRPDDMFFGAKVGDVQTDWVNTSKIAIPQADEQQRLLVNMITLMERDKLPLPHFWYLPRGEKAVVVLTGDDHSPVSSDGATASNFDRFKVLSPAGCAVTSWECVRATSYILPVNPLTQAQVDTYVADGFEIALHPVVDTICPTAPISTSELSGVFGAQLDALAAKYPNLPAPVSSRTHCVYWPDWAGEAKIEHSYGIRLDMNYYHYPASWIGSKPGFLNGGGFPMRFADLDGTMIDVYQQNTHMTDESGQQFPATINALLDNAVGANGFYGAFTANVHTDFGAPQTIFEEIVASAQARGVPLISSTQLLDWVDGRDNSSIRELSWSSGTLTFTSIVGAGAAGLQTMLPVQGPAGSLTAITHAGSAVAYTVQTIKGVQYAMFDAATGSYQATYS